MNPIFEFDDCVFELPWSVTGEVNWKFFFTVEVFELHMEELRAKQEEITKRDNDIKLLEAIIQTLGGKEWFSTSL